MTTATDAELVALYANEVVPHRYCSVIGLTLALTDICYTFPREVKFFWRGKASIPRFMYFIIRYAPLLFTGASAVAAFEDSASDAFCTAFPYYQFTIGTVHVWAVQVVLLLRIHAIYNSRKLLWALIFFFFATTVIQAGLGFSAEATTRWRPVGVFGCLPFNLEKLRDTLWLTWLPTLAFDFVVFILAIMTLRQYRNITKMSVKRRTLLSTLLLDSMKYFTIIVLILIIYMYVARAHIEYIEDLSDIIIGVISACGCRLLYNLRSHIETEDGICATEPPTPGTALETLAFRVDSNPGEETDEVEQERI